jgi:hypothetical protein
LIPSTIKKQTNKYTNKKRNKQKKNFRQEETGKKYLNDSEIASSI